MRWLWTAVAGACLVVGCEADPHALRWRFRPQPGSERPRAAALETSSLEGGCTSDRGVFFQTFPIDSPAERPPALAPGRYGFAGQLLDEGCDWVASGCREVELPYEGEVVVELAPVVVPLRDCASAFCPDEQCGATADAGGGDAAGPADAMVDDGGVDAAMAPLDAASPTPDGGAPPRPVMLAFEAEAADSLAPPMGVSEDQQASQARYISYPWDPALSPEQNLARKRNLPPEGASEGFARYDFAVPRSGDFRVWGRVMAQSLDEDSFWVRMDDDGPWIEWNDIVHGEWWRWTDVRRIQQPHTMVLFELDSGPHTLWIYYREVGTKLDRLLITDDLEFVPPDE